MSGRESRRPGSGVASEDGDAGPEAREAGPETPPTPTGPGAADVGRLHERVADRGGARIFRPHGGRPTVERFGDLEEEHGHLARAAGLLDETDRGIVEVAGRRARRMLDGLITNDLAPLDEGRAVYTFLLTSKGRPVAEARVLPRDGSTVWLDVPAACLEGLLEHLERTLPPLYARFSLRPELARLAVVGPRAADALLAWPAGPGAAAAEVPPLSITRAGGEDPDLLAVVRREPEEGPGFDIYARASAVERVWEELEAAVRAAGGGPVGRRAYDIWRIERGIPAYGTDIGRDNLPQETGQEKRAISFSKGCYTGQEVVARIHYRGHVNRHLRGLRFEGRSEAGGADVGTTLYREGREVGSVTSAARSPRLGTIGLGYVRREVEPGERVAAKPDGARTVEVVELPFTST